VAVLFIHSEVVIAIPGYNFQFWDPGVRNL